MTIVSDDEIARGRRIRLRRKRLEDAPADYAWRRDPELARFDAASPLRSSYNDFLVSFREDVEYPTPFRRVYAIEDLGGHHIGNVMYYNIDERRKEAELGITIGDKRFWSRHFGRDAIETFLRYLFNEVGLHRVYLNTLDWNERAQQSFLAAGFVECGTLRRGVHNFITMEALHDTWLAEHPEPASESRAPEADTGL